MIDDESPASGNRVCRYCSKGIVQVLDLGRQALANDYRFASDPVPEKYPLTYSCCRACGLLQLDHAVNPRDLYSTYAYKQKGSISVARHATEVASRFGGKGKFVVEVASNDGLFLEVMAKTGAKVLGVEPAANIAADAEKAGVPTLVRFFDRDLGAAIAEDHGKADVVIARNVFGHLPSPHGFLDGAAALLKDDGVLLIEVPSLNQVFTQRDYVQFYAEHCTFPGAWNLGRLLPAHGLTLTGVEAVDLHGGSNQFQIRKHGTPDGSVLKMQAAESVSGALRDSGWEQFAREARYRLGRVRENLEILRDSGKTIAGYTAPAKLSVLCQWGGIDKRLLPAVFDTTPEKVGRLVAGTDIPIHGEDIMARWTLDGLFVGAHNLGRELKKRWPNRTLYRAIPEWGEVS